ncbi:competence/damage-inducible protein A [Pediococcus claussenii]|uniref:Putative competence-damage inducible protein n=1 Tax=Pediococcus claussenii (strain ATCC BAA-344 / DSM 14800 / JCM 18046 / KCTC 3811 / LMG 21948 / P06) TaxID=701521 RepID=G8PCL5_PEDCP|nr:competence/damage-inducible protein A [Pediococcus claussenii]AEV95000.1 Putative competence-damage inducible protein CinA [Pediococcus claussenii ATCC BAA-344]ANZ70189.1 competence/damage-inducible protein A [Pediococcus claussenii]ANZ72005.1 competence/damage-inducible protein A [Pediococcus claussenii]KRN19198.1 cinA protein [Pediococcus claussenii]
MKAELISVGTEILLGEITDTNATYLSKSFADLGIEVMHRQTVGDNIERIDDALKLATGRSNLVVLIGGLGPTEDDVTKPALAQFLNKDLVQDKDALNKINKRFEMMGRSVTPNNLRQAWILDNAERLTNYNGLAVGMFESGNVNYVVLPGPPSEFRMMVDRSLIPVLKKHFNLQNNLVSKTLHFVGISESLLAEKLDDIIRYQTNPTLALYFKDTDVTVRITAEDDNRINAEKMVKDMENTVLKRVGQFYYSDEEIIDLHTFVAQQLIKRNISITAAESLTGGLFESTICSVSGVSAIFNGGFVTYSNQSKHDLVDVSSDLIQNNGVVSKEVAEAMASGARRKMNTKLSLSFTGVAGPGELEGHKAGNFWIGLALDSGEIYSEEFNVDGDREKVRQAAVNKAFEMILKFVLK